MPVRLTQEEFLDRLPKDIEFKPNQQIPNTKTPISWICNKGHHFKAPLKNLIRRPLCTVCHPSRKTVKHSLQDAKALAKENGFIFLEDTYIGNKHLHTLRCMSCGTIQQRRMNAITRGIGCPHCSGKRKLTWEIVRDKAAEKGIEVPKCVIEGSKVPITVLCRAGDIPHEYEVIPARIMAGHGCPVCAGTQRLTSKEVNLRLKALDVPFKLADSEYKNNRSFHTFECTACSYSVETTYNNMCRGRRCPVCNPKLPFGEFPEKPHKLYYLRIDSDGLVLYKIGITSKSDVIKRFSSKGDLDKITVLRTLEFDTGQKAFDLEQYYLRLFHEQRYQGPPILKSGGNTELFTHDILGLDTLNQKPL